ncbi:hypothetical protein [Candidatus Kinetoplastidibacterium crithidiae]|nr:hypothetical protein [Candidatus Kinetoplastibacterium crithidii]
MKTNQCPYKRKLHSGRPLLKSLFILAMFGVIAKIIFNFFS